jgi:hypothetical protein
MPALLIATWSISGVPLERIAVGRPASFRRRSAARFSGKGDRQAYWFISWVRCAPSSQPQAGGGKVEAVPGDVPEGLVAARQAADEAVFDLLLAPQLGKRRPLPGNSCSASRPTE